MPVVLQNSNLELRIDLPSENYTGSRFDHSAKIVGLTYKGVSLLSTELENQNAIADKSYGKGLYNEFGSVNPLGYEAADIGENFHKIGVGILTKTTDAYANQVHLESIPIAMEYDISEAEIQFRTESPLVNGYAYRLLKKVTLTSDGFTISYALTNLGNHIIRTNEYNHNFLRFNELAIGKGYELTLPSEIRLPELTELVNKEKVMTIEGKTILFEKTPSTAFFISMALENRSVDAIWKLEHQDLKIGISEQGDFSTKAFHLWGCSHVISPELFIDLEVAPSETARWKRRFTLYQIP